MFLLHWIHLSDKLCAAKLCHWFMTQPLCNKIAYFVHIFRTQYSNNNNKAPWDDLLQCTIKIKMQQCSQRTTRWNIFVKKKLNFLEYFAMHQILFILMCVKSENFMTNWFWIHDFVLNCLSHIIFSIAYNLFNSNKNFKNSEFVYSTREKTVMLREKATCKAVYSIV